MTNINKMLANGSRDGNFAQLGTKGASQTDRIGIRAVRSAKAGHGNRNDTSSIKTKPIKGTNRYQKSKRRVKTPRDTNDNTLRAGMRKAGSQAMRLDTQHFFAALSSTVIVCRHKWARIDKPRQLCHILKVKCNIDNNVLGIFRARSNKECRKTTAFSGKCGYVNFRHRNTVRKTARIGQYMAIFTYKVMSGEDQIRS